MDWVEKEARGDKVLIKNRQKIWDDLGTALQQAGQSFNRCYRHEGEVTTDRPYPDHFWVRSRLGPAERSAHFVLTLRNSIEVEVVVARHVESEFSLRFTTNDLGEVTLAVDSGKLVTAEEISKVTLEPVLFSEPTQLYPLALEGKP